jgi:predicted HAD superfamily Cof-like phosphohydrolase
MTIFDRIVEFNEQRHLLKEPNWQKEFSFIAEEMSEGLRANDIEGKIDALADIIVFATGAIKKAGYNPNIIMEEVLQHIESDKGYFDEDQGKWIKIERTYTPDFNKAK